jgi:hypothetical protein
MSRVKIICDTTNFSRVRVKVLLSELCNMFTVYGYPVYG